MVWLPPCSLTLIGATAMPSPVMLMAIAAIGGSLAVVGGLLLAVARFICDRPGQAF